MRWVHIIEIELEIFMRIPLSHRISLEYLSYFVNCLWKDT